MSNYPLYGVRWYMASDTLDRESLSKEVFDAVDTLVTGINGSGKNISELGKVLVTLTIEPAGDGGE